MGQAKQRGTLEQRRAQAVEKAAIQRAERAAASSRNLVRERAIEAALSPEEREQLRARRNKSALLRAQIAGMLAASVIPNLHRE